MNTKLKISLSLFLLLLSSSKFSYHTSLGNSSVLLQTGVFTTNPGESQHINILTLTGDRYSARKSYSENIIFGLSYLINGPQISLLDLFNTSYGISGHYLAKSKSSGIIYKELVTPGLGYRYSLEHFPVHAMTKIESNKTYNNYIFTAEAGIGPNFLNLYNYQEKSLDSISVPLNRFSQKSNTTFSASVGFGIKLKEVFDQNPLECGYKLFYLGNSSLKKNMNTIINKLKTGDIYAHTVMCSIAIS